MVASAPPAAPMRVSGMNARKPSFSIRKLNTRSFPSPSIETIPNAMTCASAGMISRLTSASKVKAPSGPVKAKGLGILSRCSRSRSGAPNRIAPLRSGVPGLPPARWWKEIEVPKPDRASCPARAPFNRPRKGAAGLASSGKGGPGPSRCHKCSVCSSGVYRVASIPSESAFTCPANTMTMAGRMPKRGFMGASKQTDGPLARSRL